MSKINRHSQPSYICCIWKSCGWPSTSSKIHIFTLLLWLSALLIKISNDVHPNPGPTLNETASKNFFTFAHWNLNSIKAHNFSRVHLISSYLLINKCDIFAVSETALNGAVPDTDLEIVGYNFFRCDLQNGDTHGGVLIYYKTNLALRRFPNLETHPNTLVTEVSFGRKRVVFTVIYRKPSQTPEEFRNFITNLSNLYAHIKNLNPYLAIFVGDFNAHSSTWWTGDRDDECGNTLSNLLNENNLHQLVKQPTYLTSQNRSSCIDLVISDQPNLFLDCDIHPSLHPTCHHQINYCKVNIANPLPKPYKRRLWYYGRANEAAIHRCINEFDWDRSLDDCAHDPNLQVKLYTETILNIFENFVPYKDVVIKPKEPPWLTSNIRIYFNKYRNVFKKFNSRGRPEIMTTQINEMREHYTKLVSDAKNRYFERLGKKLRDPSTGPKTYHSVLKNLMGDIKNTIIPPILSNNTFICESIDKANTFNNFFAKQCTTVQTNSVLPDDDGERSPYDIRSINFTLRDICDLLKGLNPNKSHGCDNISIRMLKLCGEGLAKPLFKIYNNCVNKNVFPTLWKKGNVIPIHKKDEKYLIKNYRPISLLPISGKLFEKLIFNNLYSHFFDNKIISDKQSGFRKGDSTVKQLISICHNIFRALDAFPPLEARGVFLDISKAFDKVWHEGLIFKLRKNGVNGDLLNLISDFLINRLQRVNLEGVESTWQKVEAGVPQGSILGPLLFLVYINDLLYGVQSNAFIFADDTSLFHIGSNPEDSSMVLNRDLTIINIWANQWKMIFNPDISKQAVEVVFSKKQPPTIFPDLNFNGIPVKKVAETKHLGVVLDSKLKFKSHISSKIKKARRGIGIVKRISPFVSRKTLNDVYKMYIRPHIDYADVLYHIPNKDILAFLSVDVNYDLHTSMKQVESVQYDAALAVSGAWRGSSRTKLYNELGWEPLYLRREVRRLCLFREILIDKNPPYLHDIVKPFQPRHNSRSDDLNVPFSRTDSHKNTFIPASVIKWNLLDGHTKNLPHKLAFKSSLIKQIRPKRCEMFLSHDNIGQSWITQLRVGLSPLNLHKFAKEFQDTHDPMCVAGDGIEDTEHFLLFCRLYHPIRRDLFNNINLLLQKNINTLPNAEITKLLLFGDSKLNTNTNKKILINTVSFIRNSNRFSLS